VTGDADTVKLEFYNAVRLPTEQQRSISAPFTPRRVLGNSKAGFGAGIAASRHVVSRPLHRLLLYWVVCNGHKGRV
jgi:hypothetical protein